MNKHQNVVYVGAILPVLLTIVIIFDTQIGSLAFFYEMRRDEDITKLHFGLIMILSVEYGKRKKHSKNPDYLSILKTRR